MPHEIDFQALLPVDIRPEITYINIEVSTALPVDELDVFTSSNRAYFLFNFSLLFMHDPIILVLETELNADPLLSFLIGTPAPLGSVSFLKECQWIKKKNIRKYVKSLGLSRQNIDTRVLRWKMILG